MKHVAIAFEVANGVDVHTLTRAVAKMLKGPGDNLSPYEYAALSSVKTIDPAVYGGHQTLAPEA